MDQQTFLNDTPENLLKKYRKVLKKHAVPVEKFIVFGSFAKKTQHEGSDLDVCVVSKQFGQDSFREMVMLSKYAAQIDPLIEPHPYHPKDLENRWDPLAEEIRRHGIVLESTVKLSLLPKTLRRLHQRRHR